MGKFDSRYVFTERDFEKFFKKYYKLALLISVRITDNFNLSEDVVQDVFLGLWEKSDIRLSDESAKSYLLKAVKNKSLNSIRNNNEYIQVESNLLNRSSDEYDFEKEEKISKALSEVENLPPKCKEIFNLIVLKELKYKDVSDQLGISVNTVKTQLSIAYKHLRKFCMIFF
ncbi:RNA polymerase sigma-70 factor [Sunxiuqinia sp. A32]|uniref:RNA polymerase sigma-70 factor n=1 Tax=Sunxiuqinia sp. A32 TaxID=3461496 RepID=UPI00404560A1